MGSVDALIVGLGNPGGKYARTRHNVGWMAVDALLEEHGAKTKAKYHGRYAEVQLGEIPVGVLTPETFMNDSGRSVGACLRDLRLPIDELVVIYDDIERGRWPEGSQRPALPRRRPWLARLRPRPLRRWAPRQGRPARCRGLRPLPLRGA
jgi:hypothetical protein